MSQNVPKMMFDKIWDAHRVKALGDRYDLIYIDRHMMHELATDRAFAQIKEQGYPVRRADLTVATHDHVVSTALDRHDQSIPSSSKYIQRLRDNAEENRIKLFGLGDREQGIVHVVAPEQGIALPGTTLVCGDSHTCTVGGLGALSWGIGTSEVAHVLATQTLVQSRPRTMRITCNGMLQRGVSAKDLILHIIGALGADAGEGYAIEYAGSAVRELAIEGRLTLCNLSIELGARMGQVAPDDTTYDYLMGRPYAPAGELWEHALSKWQSLSSDEGAVADREESIDVAALEPQITWGTSPALVGSIAGAVPDPGAASDAVTRRGMEKALEYMGLEPGTEFENIPIDNVFIGSCTNSRLSDLHAAAAMIGDRKVADGVRAMVVPGSTEVRAQAEAEGLHKTFLNAGFEWRQAGCSMCVGINDDQVASGKRCVSTSNRNFEHRQGTGARTHLASPATAAASALTGHITDPRRLVQ
ncbi:MAG: 3-isopropylmalate dehydratase large subunit [Pseudomonadota bacterium]